MATQETVYLVTTKYLIDASPTPNLDRRLAEVERRLDMMGKRARSTGQTTVDVFDKGARGATRFSSAMGAAFGPFARYAAGLVTITAGIAALTRSIGELAGAQEAQIQMAGSFNRFFSMDTSPARNWQLSMLQAKKLTKDLIAEGMRLPATTSEMFEAARAMSGPLFSQGRGPRDLLRWTSNLTLAAPQAAQSIPDAANQVQRMLAGTASVGDNPLFATMVNQRLLPIADVFNKLPSAERVRRVDAAMTEFGGNEFFKGNYFDTLKVQFSTLQDLLFGPAGIGGQVAGVYFDDLIAGLKNLNETIQADMPAIVGGFRLLGDSIELIWDRLKNMLGVPLFMWGYEQSKPFLARYGENAARSDAREKANQTMDLVYGSIGIPTTGEGFLARGRGRTSLGGGTYLRRGEQEALRAFEEGREGFGAALAERYQSSPDFIGGATKSAIAALSSMQVADPAQARSLFLELVDRNLAELKKASEAPLTLSSPPQVTNNFGPIRIDMKSDTSPEGIALNLEKAVEIVTRRRRGPDRSSDPLGPGTR